MTTVFVRNDDVGDRTPALEAVTRMLTEVGLPVSLQVVPIRLTDTGTRYLLGLKEKAPEVVSLHQHGYTHQQVIEGRHLWTEFAGGRPFDDQLDAIERGRQIIEDRLGDALGRTVFTPPSHKYDENTVRALDHMGFEVLSAAHYTGPKAQAYYAVGRATRRVTLFGHRVSHHGRRIPRSRLLELSVSVDVDAAAASPTPEEAVAVVGAAFKRARRLTEWVGLMMHHERFREPEQQANLRAVLQDIAAAADVRLMTIEGVASAVLNRR